LKAALKKRNPIAVLLACALSLAFPALVHGGICHAVEERGVVLHQGETVKRVPVGGTIVRTFAVDAGLYYCAARDGAAAGELLVGYVDFLAGAIGFERGLGINAAEKEIAGMMAGDNAVYLRAVPRGEPGAPGDLIRLPGVKGEISLISGVLDFYVRGVDCYMLVKTDARPRLVLNELSVPLSLTEEGPLRIREVVDGRIVLVSSLSETEVVDIRTGKSLYQYATAYEFLEPEGFNLVIQAVDINVPDPNDRDMIFYKVIIDGVESGRTDSGPAGLAREMKVMVEPNRYHSVRLERWILNSGKGRYDRENNIRQPKSQHLYIPLNRVVKLIITFNNKDYLFNIAPVYK
jgi:hypothetical protein